MEENLSGTSRGTEKVLSIKRASRTLVLKTLGKPSAFDCSSIENLPDKVMKSAFASKNPRTT